jgi:hypothetical protein
VIAWEGAQPMTDASREVYFEFRAVGSVVRVSAIDAATGTEVIVMGPVSAPQSTLERLARSKLMAKLQGKLPGAR